MTRLILILACILTLGLGTTAQAQGNAESILPSWYRATFNQEDIDAVLRANLETLLVENLNAPDPDVRAQAIQDIIHLEKNYPNQTDFGKAAWNLYNIYRFDKHDGMRILALAGLHAIGDRPTMRLVGQYVKRERSDRVRKHTVHVLAEFFGTE